MIARAFAHPAAEPLPSIQKAPKMNPSLRRFLDTTNLLPWSVFVVGLCIAAASALWLRDDIESKAQHEFNVHAHRLAEDIKRRFETPVYGLNGARGVYAAKGDDVSRQQFRNYVESRNLNGEFPGVRGMGFVQRVERADLDRFIARERADEEPHFAVRQLTPVEREDLYVIKIIEPRSPNHGALGLDLGSEARRRAGAEQAVITGEATLSAAVSLVQDDKKRPGFLLYVPVFRAGTDPSTSQQRFDALLGLTYAPIVAEELLADAMDITAGAVDYDLYDQKDAKTTSNWVHGTATSTRESRYMRSEAVAVPGRQLALEMRSTAVFEASIPTELPWYTLGLGSYVSLLLALLLRQQATGRVRAEELARGMTADLARLAQVAKHTSNSVVITDPELRIVWINEGFTRISGFSYEEAVGRTHEQLLNPGPEGREPGVLKDLAGNELAQEGCRVEIAYRSKQGLLYWLDAEFQPLYNAQGEHTGFMEIGSDVTERLQAQTQLQAALRENNALLRTIDMHAIVSMTSRRSTTPSARSAAIRAKSCWGRTTASCIRACSPT
jgi:PAS domain S-box-containing protein